MKINDYSSQLHLIDFQIGKTKDTIKQLKLLLPDIDLIETTNGFQARIPIQVIPEIVKVLVTCNIAVYQVFEITSI